MNIDIRFTREDLEKALNVLFDRKEVFEVRVLDTKRIGSYARQGTASGYFDTDHIGELCESLDTLVTYKAVYFTLNPVNPDALARCSYRLEFAKTTTSDADIAYRKWLPLDFDPERVSGVSSNEDEHQSALSFADEVRGKLLETFNAEPLYLDSGNGAHLLYRIDLPNDDGATALVKGVLEEFARYMQKDGVKLDKVNYNASRIWKLPGTWARKGDNVPDRPHRMARIINLPKEIKTVTGDLLKAIIPAEATVSKMETATIPKADGFDGAQWVAEHFPDAVGEAYNGGTKWVLKVCPFNPDHNRGEAVITMAANGAMGFKCQHNSCADNHWKELRALMEPGCYDRKEADTSNVDFKSLTGEANSDAPVLQPADYDALIAARIRENEESKPLKEWQKITDDDVRGAIEGTCVGRLNDIYGSVSRPTLPIAASLLKTFTTIGCCLSGEATNDILDTRYKGNMGHINAYGRERANVIINTAGGQLCNIYAILVGNSSSGKDLGTLQTIFTHTHNPYCRQLKEGDPMHFALGTGGSGEGVLDRVIRCPNGLMVISELEKYIAEGNWKHDAISSITEAFNSGSFDQALSERGGKSGSRTSNYCALSVMANVQPGIFKKLLTSSSIDNGFIGRCMIADMGEYYGLPNKIDLQATKISIEEIAKVYLCKNGIVDLPITYADDLNKLFIENCDDKRLIPNARRLAFEYYPRIALQLSCTEGEIGKPQTKAVITDEGLARARKIILWLFANVERLMSDVYCDLDKDSAALNEVIDKVFADVAKIYEKNRKPVTWTELCRNGSMSRRIIAKYKKQAIEELKDRGRILVYPMQRTDGYLPIK